MPELPDVEIVRRRLNRWLSHAHVEAAITHDARVSRPGAPSAFRRALVGRTIERIDRKGKWLRVALDDGGRLFSHLGMTGDWIRVARGAPTQRFERARLDVGEHSVRYVDMRRFGRLVAAKRDIPEWKELGPDPLAEGLDALFGAFARSRRTVKEVLMDQAVVAGVGNIIATEALWMARVDPRSAANALTPADVQAVARAVRREIERELSNRDLRFFVYGRVGEPCPRCKATIKRVKLGGRTSAFCPKCQARRRARIRA